MAKKKSTTKKKATKKSTSKPESTAKPSDKFPKVRAYYVASSHWDREWYEPFQHYRFRLVDVMDEMLDLLENDPQYAHYQLDGQAVMLEDYLDIRPEHYERLVEHFDSGKLEAGPWYVLPDEFLVSGESIVRNLLRGHQVLDHFADPMPVGFACDLFGHISQLPQIFRGFGIQDAVVWRGASPSKHGAYFKWCSPDGSEVWTFSFGRLGYGLYEFTVREPNRKPDRTLDQRKALASLKAMVAEEAERIPGQAVLLFDGLDHMEPEPKTSALLNRARKAGLDVKHARLIDFLDDLRKQKLRPKTVTGELREPAEMPGSYVIPGVAASRIYLKQRNARCESTLTQWLEPHAAWATLLGQTYPTAYLDHAWRYLLLNHPHDSICGCSGDQIHTDMLYRFDQVDQITQRALQMSQRAIVDRTRLPELEGDEDFAVTIFNPSDDPIDGVVDIPLHFKRETKHRFQEWFGYEEIIGFRLYDEKNREIGYQRLDVEKLVPVKHYDKLAKYHGEKVEQVRVAVPVKLPPRGWTTLCCKPTDQPSRHPGSQLVDDHTFANEFLYVSINPNGTLDVTDLAADLTYQNLLTFEERADIGDGWYHGTAINDEIHTSIGSAADIALIHDGPYQTTFKIRVMMNVPRRFELDKRVMKRSDEIAPLVMTSWVTLKAGQAWLEVHTEIENTVTDHRVRVLCPSYLEVEQFASDSAFDVILRDIALRSDNHELIEPELETKPQATWAAVNDGESGLAVISVGQPEVAVRDLPDRPIALTLMRGFQRTVAQEGEMGGQMLGRSEHDYWIFPHRGELPRTQLFRLGQRLAAGVQAMQTDKRRVPFIKQPTVLGASGSWLDPGDGPLVLTACKEAEDGEGLILRLFNPLDEKIEQTLSFAGKVEQACLTNLLEIDLDPVPKRGKTVTVEAQAKQIVTLRVELAKLV
jgi:alpha-mannosidase